MYSVNSLSKAKQSKAKQSKAKQSKAKRELRALNNNSFKTFLTTLLSLTLLFSISCSNEGTTGGGDTGDNYNYNYFSVSEDWNNSKDITVISRTSSSSVYSAGTVGFSVYGATDYTISIESVTMGSGGSLTLDVSDFIYSQSTKDLRLSTSGLTKFQNASSGLTEKQKYQYTITFKIATSSESKNVDVNVNLIKAKVITKAEVEAMMKKITTEKAAGSSPTGVVSIYGGGNYANFNFSSFTIGSGVPNFKSTVESSTDIAGKSYSAANSSATIGGLSTSGIQKIADYRTLFGYSSIDWNKQVISGKKCTFYFIFKVPSGCALESSIQHIATTGLTIELTLANGSWTK